MWKTGCTPTDAASQRPATPLVVEGVGIDRTAIEPGAAKVVSRGCHLAWRKFDYC
jgi:hypothetical protein